ncbi:MAG: Na+:solute symporter [Candidatus Marinimicrobia bacterium]|nr:Na+:solute symporter [Candidatus Neomarinimicrobiota bacterium]MCF7828447.1 Na+:solute symporter [Candidatus Neomarinimicrobiota bacterium]MCF7880959.1 Na+:solute symporter [Candidatus Neomarinimicrobiota bacterium]
MIDLLIIFAFIVYSISNGFRHQSKASENLEEYFLAGRSVKGWKAGFSMAATQFAADTPLLVTGLIATGGIFMLWRLWIYGLGFLMIGFLLGRAWRRAQVITDAELTEIRYSGRGVLALRGLKAIYYGTVMNCTIMAMVLVAATRISEVFLLWHQWLPDSIYQPILNLVQYVGVPLASGATEMGTFIATTNNVISIVVIIAFTALYSTTGGLRSVIATDSVQFVIAMVGTIIYAIIVVIQSGGLGDIIANLVDLYGQAKASQLLSFSPNTGEALLPFLVIISLQWFFERNSDGTGYFAQRLMACKSDDDARFAAFIFTWLQIFLRSLVWLVIGVGLLVIYPFDPGTAGGEGFTAAREILFATGIKDLLPVGVKGLMLTGMLAALASTIDTHLTWGASYWSNDIYLRIVNRKWLNREPSDREQVIVARLSNALILGIALVIMANLKSIQTAWYITLLFGAGTGAVLVLRWLWERINLYSEISAIIVSLIVAPIILFTVEAEWLRLLLMSSISTVVVITVTLLTRPTNQSVLHEFYRRVDPPGFWRNTSGDLQVDTERPMDAFKEGVYLTITTSLSVFLLLIGFGKLILPNPAANIAYSWIYIIVGFASIGLWWNKLIPKLQRS